MSSDEKYELSEEDLRRLIDQAEKCTQDGLYMEHDDSMSPREVYRIVPYAAYAARHIQGTTARPSYVATVYTATYAQYCVWARPNVVRALGTEVLAQRKEIEGLRKERLNIQDLRKHIRELRGLLDDAKKKIRDLGGEP